MELSEFFCQNPSSFAIIKVKVVSALLKEDIIVDFRNSNLSAYYTTKASA